MSKRQDIVKEVRSWIGTPWRHQGRTRGVACDCLGLAQAAAEAVGQMPAHLSTPTYERRPKGDQLRKTFDDNLDRIDPADAKAGDLVLFSMRQPPAAASAPPKPTHVGVLAPHRHDGEGPPFSLVHAMIETGAVSEQVFDPERLRLVPVGYYRFRGLD